MSAASIEVIAPVIECGDTELEIAVGTEYEISWTGNDLYGMDYYFYIDDVLHEFGQWMMDNGQWHRSVLHSYFVSDLSVGDHALTFTVSDLGRNIASHIVNVNVIGEETPADTEDTTTDDGDGTTIDLGVGPSFAEILSLMILAMIPVIHHRRKERA